jgi:hypothetical protein
VQCIRNLVISSKEARAQPPCALSLKLSPPQAEFHQQPVTENTQESISNRKVELSVQNHIKIYKHVSSPLSFHPLRFLGHVTQSQKLTAHSFAWKTCALKQVSDYY